MVTGAQPASLVSARTVSTARNSESISSSAVSIVVVRASAAATDTATAGAAPLLAGAGAGAPSGLAGGVVLDPAEVLGIVAGDSTAATTSRAAPVRPVSWDDPPQATAPTTRMHADTAQRTEEARRMAEVSVARRLDL